MSELQPTTLERYATPIKWIGWLVAVIAIVLHFVYTDVGRDISYRIGKTAGTFVISMVIAGLLAGWKAQTRIWWGWVVAALMGNSLL